VNIWNWRSAAIIWIFAWGWLIAFDSCAPTRERWSVEHREEQVAADHRAARQAESEAQDAAEEAIMCASEARVEEICNPPEEPGFLCSIFTCEEDEEEGEASSP
jgi:hypothetical protein